MEVLKAINLVVRFILELGALVALGYWGFHAGKTMRQKYALAMIAPITAAGIWGLFVAPNASTDVPGAVHLTLQIAIFGAAALSLAAVGWRRWAMVFAVVALFNGILMYVWDQ